MSSESVVACLSVPIEAPSSCLVCDWSEEKEDLDPEYFTVIIHCLWRVSHVFVDYGHVAEI